MYIKYFFENYWAPTQKNQLFVCMPFDNSFDEKFEKINQIAINLGFDCAKRVKEELAAKDLLHEILDGIGNSRTLLFDLSNDPKSCQINGNVLYELGIATAIREPDDILLIREVRRQDVINLKKDTPFNINHLNHNNYEGELQGDWLKEKIKKVADGQKWYMSKRVEMAAKSIDGVAYELMLGIYGKRKDGEDNFHDADLGKNPIVKLAVLRLIDLGIIRFETARDRTKKEWSLYWTPFGKEVMKYLGIEKAASDVL